MDAIHPGSASETHLRHWVTVDFPCARPREISAAAVLFGHAASSAILLASTAEASGWRRIARNITRRGWRRAGQQRNASWDCPTTIGRGPISGLRSSSLSSRRCEMFVLKHPIPPPSSPLPLSHTSSCHCNIERAKHTSRDVALGAEKLPDHDDTGKGSDRPCFGQGGKVHCEWCVVAVIGRRRCLLFRWVASGVHWRQHHYSLLFLEGEGDNDANTSVAVPLSPFGWDVVRLV